MSTQRARVVWPLPSGDLVAWQPTEAEVHQHAQALMLAYNEPHNRSMMGHAEMSARDVDEHFAQMKAAGAVTFLLARKSGLTGELMGDADFRNIEPAQAEFAIMIGGRSAQGKGLGQRYSLMLHALAFRFLGLERVYVTVIDKNKASRRLFEKLGYQIDVTPEIRAHVDDESDVAMSIDRASFEALHAAQLKAIRVEVVEEVATA